MSTDLQNGLRTYRPDFLQYTYCSERVSREVANWAHKTLDQNGGVTRCLMITGQTGLGKTTLALALAGFLGVSERDIQQVNCGDVRTLEDARGLINSSLMYGPSSGNYRVLILDEVHQMVPNAQRAFLTPLEQLAHNIIVVCATSNPEMLQAPFRGRFYEIRLEPYTEDAIVDILMNLPTPPEPSTAVLAARAAYGNPRRAIAMIEKGVTEADAEEIKAEMFRIEDFIRAIMTGNVSKAYGCVSALKTDQTVKFVQETCGMIETLWLDMHGAKPIMSLELKKFFESVNPQPDVWCDRQDLAWLHEKLQKHAFAHPNEFKSIVMGYFDRLTPHERLQRAFNQNSKV